MLKKLTVRLPSQKAYFYPIYIADNLLNEWQQWLPNYANNRQIVVITDKTVNELYAKSWVAQLECAGYKVLLLIIEPGEKAKTGATKEQLELTMLKHKFDRHGLCIALGGGVVGDLAGFLAATYMRGLKYIQIPTTLLAMVDSSVGGKTAVNTPYGKNLIGAFWQPQLVVMDTLTLTSLPQELVINGLIEALKVFLTSDAKSFHYANRYLNQILAADKAKLQSVIKRAVKIKAEIVRSDEKEENLRMILNFGHTIGHALEKLSNYTLLHGYAVALGILVESKMAVLAGHLSLTNYTIIAELMRKLGISGASLAQFNINAVIDATLGDKKNKAGQVYCVLLTDIGTVYLDQGQKVATPVSEELIQRALTELINSDTSETALVINN